MVLAALFGLLGLFGLLQTATPAPEPRARGWDDFPVFVWRTKYAGKPLPKELAEPFGGVILMRDEDSGWAREQGLSYLVWNVAGRNALHLDADEAWNERVESWIQTHDEKLLVREPCLNDPKTIETLFATLAATVAKHGEHPGLGFVLGDEVSLTPNGDPFDLCRCGFCEAKWKAYAKEHDLPERAPLTDEVRLALLADDFSSLGAWLARRRFDAQQIVERLEPLIEKSRMSPSSTLPAGPYAGLLGCKDQTAFGGLALDERLLRCLGLIECYATGGARELAATVPGLPRHAVLHGSSGPDPGPGATITTLFVGEENAAGLAWGVYDAWMRGDTGLVLWSDAALEALPSDARARLVEALDTVRTLTWKLPANEGPTPLRFWPQPRTIALVRDADSTAASFLRDALIDGPTWPRRKASYQREHGRLERKVETWLRLSEDCGLEPGVLPLASVCARCASQFGVLVLPEVLVLGDDDVERLASYVEGGGWLVVDGTLGWVDRAGLSRNGDELRARLAGSHPERLRETPELVSSYLESRADFTRGTRAREFVLALPPVQRVRRWLEESGLPRPSGEAGTVPWRMHLSVLGDGDALLVLLPNETTLEDRRAHLRDVSLEGVQAPKGFELRWLRPAEGHVLRAGDAALAHVTRVR